MTWINFHDLITQIDLKYYHLLNITDRGAYIQGMIDGLALVKDLAYSSNHIRRLDPRKETKDNAGKTQNTVRTGNS